MNKTNLRNIYKHIRSKISNIEKIEAEKLIINKLEKYLKKNLNIAIYYPLKEEVNLLSLQETYPKILLPKITSNNSLKFYNINETLIINSKFNIKEPVGIEPITPEIVICPLLAFDHNKNRLGYGKGYYDKYLANHNIFKIGAAFSVQKTNSIPSEPHDIKMDIIVTEDKIY
jgi:5-formyltetrahydrofolate cyclo-ligase